MIGFDMAIYRTGEVKNATGVDKQFEGLDEDLLHYVEPTPLGRLEITPFALVSVADDVISISGYPSILQVRAKYLPYPLGVDDDDVVYVVCWDQS